MAKEDFNINVADLGKTTFALDESGLSIAGESAENKQRENKANEELKKNDDEFDKLKNKVFKTEEKELIDIKETGDEVKEEGEEKKEKENIDSGTKDVSKPEEINILLTPYAATLKDENILPNLNIEEFNKKATTEEKLEMLIDQVKSEISLGVDQYKETLPDVIKDLAKNYEEGVPIMDLLELKDEAMRLDGIKEENVEEDEQLQKDLLTYHYKKTTSFSKEKINKEIEGKLKSGTIIEEAKSALEELREINKQEEKKTIEEAKKQNIIAQERSKKYLQEIKDNIKNTQEIIPGVKVTDKQKKDIEQWWTKPVAVDPETKQPIWKTQQVRAKNPQEFDKKTLYLISIGYYDDKTNIDPIEKGVKTKYSKSLTEKFNLNSGYKPGEMAGDHLATDKEVPITDAVEALLKKMGK